MIAQGAMHIATAEWLRMRSTPSERERTAMEYAKIWWQVGDVQEIADHIEAVLHLWERKGLESAIACLEEKR